MKVVLVDYWSGNHVSYAANLHDPKTDRCLDQASHNTPLEKAILAAGAVDGDEIEIVVRKTGRRPFGDRKYRFTKPHTYEREPEPEKVG